MPDIDIGQLSEVINDKMDRDLNNRSTDSGLRRLIESYHNGTEWYKVFEEIQSDGTAKYWCEQGGRVLSSASASEHIITFLKPYQDINYTITTTTGDLSGGNYQYKNSFNWEWVTVRSLTPVSFSVYAGQYACSSWSWKVEGYIS